MSVPTHFFQISNFFVALQKLLALVPCSLCIKEQDENVLLIKSKELLSLLLQARTGIFPKGFCRENCQEVLTEEDTCL
jgi:hypothetical protein